MHLPKHRERAGKVLIGKEGQLLTDFSYESKGARFFDVFVQHAVDGEKVVAGLDPPKTQRVLYGWAKPEVACDLAFDDVAVSADGPIQYRLRIKPGARQHVVVGLCEGVHANHAVPTLVWREEQKPVGKGNEEVGDMPHNCYSLIVPSNLQLRILACCFLVAGFYSPLQVLSLVC